MLSVGFINQHFKETGKFLIQHEYYALEILKNFRYSDFLLS